MKNSSTTLQKASRYETVTAKDLIINRSIGRGVLAILALIGASDVAKNAVNSFEAHTGHEYTTEQLDQMKHQPFTLEQGQGIDDAIAKVDPKLFDDGQGLADAEAYLKSQINSPAHIPQAGESFSVPVIPGKQSEK